MKVIHCADIHLNSPMETHMSEQQAAQRNAEILQTFCRLTEYAVQNNVRLVLIAGDFFDGPRITRRTADAVLDAMAQTPQVDYLYICGNHDEKSLVFTNRSIPANFKRISDRWETLFYDNVAVSGISMTNANHSSLYRDLPQPTGCFHIVMLHGQTGSVCAPDTVNLNLLKNRGIHYLALGHIHSYAQEPLDRTGVYCYSGCLEGRGFDECGEKGFVLLETNGQRFSTQFVPFAQRQLHRVEVCIMGLTNNAEVYRAMKAAAAGISSNDMVEFILTGRSDPTTQITPGYLYNLARNDFFFVEIKNNSKLAIAPADYQNDISLKGELIRLAMAKNFGDSDRETIIRTAMEALEGMEITL